MAKLLGKSTRLLAPDEPESVDRQIPLNSEVELQSEHGGDEPMAPVCGKVVRTRFSPNLTEVSTPELANNMPTNEQLEEMFGVKTRQAALGLYVSALHGAGNGNVDYRSFVLAMGAELEPKDAIEAMLVTQIATTHVAMVVSAGKASDASNVDALEAYDRIMNRLARTFGTQIEALRKYRSGVTQTVRVEHVTVNAGGQAIVGSVSAGGRGNEK